MEGLGLLVPSSKLEGWRAGNTLFGSAIVEWGLLWRERVCVLTEKRRVCVSVGRLEYFAHANTAIEIV